MSYQKIGSYKFRCLKCRDVVKSEHFIDTDDEKCFNYQKIVSGCSCGAFKELMGE